MTTTTTPNPTTQTLASDFLTDDPSDTFDTLQPVRPRLNSSPVQRPRPYLQVSYQFRDSDKSSNVRQVHPSQSDVVLIASLDGGRDPEIPYTAGAETLPQIDEAGGSQGRESAKCRITASEMPSPAAAPSPTGLDNLRSVAAAGLAVANKETDGDHAVEMTGPAGFSVPAGHKSIRDSNEMCMSLPTNRESDKSISTEPPSLIAMARQYGSPQSPRAQDPPNIARLDLHSPTGSSHGELPPMLPSPRLDTIPIQHVALPSIRSTFGDIQHLSEARSGYPSFSQPVSAIGFAPRPGQSTSPLSPRDGLRTEIPLSSSHTAHGNMHSPISRYSSYAGGNARAGVEYSSSSSTTETPSSDTVSTPSVTERMRIDNVTHPAGAFVCNFAGCTAQPFQTQYLLNSHANVHSSARPHYCSVRGCPRAEGGKGFKRKNEMIRHGLVHDSPGYVCPFCPDREHKYPRPDNLQRHVRVHHPEKDKDDSTLREVLSQRPDGPNRGRRRRGAQQG